MTYNNITIVGEVNTHVAQKYILFPKKGEIGAYTLKIVTSEEWNKEKNGIKNLGQIIDIFNNTCWSGDDKLFEDVNNIGLRLKQTAKKHNSNRWQNLRYLVFPLIAKLWGCTLFSRYNEEIVIKSVKRARLTEKENGEALWHLTAPKIQREFRPITREIERDFGPLGVQKLTEIDWIASLQSAFALGGINFTMPDDFPYSFDQLDVSKLGATWFTLENCKGRLPRGLDQLPLNELHLKNADLETLPDELSACPLKILQLHGCKMTRIPEVVYKLENLELLMINFVKGGKLILDEETCERLKTLPNLKKLRIIQSGWEDSELAELQQRLPGLEIDLHYENYEIEMQNLQNQMN